MSLWALLALISFILALFHVNLAGLDLVVLGLVFVAMHLLWVIALPVGPVNRDRR